MTDYVLGFCFDVNRNEVVMIEKRRPNWQLGKLNAPGGHIEKGETPINAVTREFFEETGLKIPVGSWEPTMVVRVAEDAIIWVFRSFSDELHKVKSMTDEPAGVYSFAEAIRHGLSNMAWMLPLMADKTVDFPAILSIQQNRRSN